MEEDAIQSLGGLITEQDLAREVERREQGGHQRLDGGGLAALRRLLLLGLGDLHVRDHPEATDVGDDPAVELVGRQGGLDVDRGARPNTGSGRTMGWGVTKNARKPRI